jgi:hypothetical protein
MLEAVGEVFPVVPRSKAKLVAKMLKAILAQEGKQAKQAYVASQFQL